MHCARFKIDIAIVIDMAMITYWICTDLYQAHTHSVWLRNVNASQRDQKIILNQTIDTKPYAFVRLTMIFSLL